MTAWWEWLVVAGVFAGGVAALIVIECASLTLLVLAVRRLQARANERATPPVRL